MNLHSDPIPAGAMPIVTLVEGTEGRMGAIPFGHVNARTGFLVFLTDAMQLADSRHGG